MNRSLAVKLGAIAFLVLLLIIPLNMIDNLISERQAQRDQVMQDIARSSSYNQKLTGPLLVVPYRKKVRQWKEDAESKQRYVAESEVSGRLYFLPETFSLDGDIQTELRSRGIYEARLYHANSKISGAFDLPQYLAVGESFPDYRFEQPFIAIGISDIRGIGNALKLKLNGETINFKPGTQMELLGNGVHAPLHDIAGSRAEHLEFSFDMELQGTGQFDITPVGRESRVMLKSDWPHPNFSGDYLPVEREIGDNGFTARWQTSFFSTNLEEALKSCIKGADCSQFTSRHFGVSLINPVDQYLKSERAIKYALLFVALTFAGFFLFEVLKRLAVHPIQYGLVGMALTLFYLLLLSLSEHVGFTLAYLISSSGCVLLIGFYVSHVLKSFWRGLGFTVCLGALYALLYGLLSAEDYALLMGSLLLFGLLGVVMVLTRKLDWYSFGKSNSAT
jgi:inner membrane protein